jgi:hypothetical protein
MPELVIPDGVRYVQFAAGLGLIQVSIRRRKQQGINTLSNSVRILSISEK